LILVRKFRKLIYTSQYNTQNATQQNETTKVCGVAQWLGRRSVAGGLSLIYA